MDRKEVQDRVKKVIAKILQTDAGSIGDEANFIFDLGADSSQSLELVAGFQEEFNVQLDEDKALSVQTVSDAVRFIEQYLK